MFVSVIRSFSTTVCASSVWPGRLSWRVRGGKGWSRLQTGWMEVTIWLFIIIVSYYQSCISSLYFYVIRYIIDHLIRTVYLGRNFIQVLWTRSSNYGIWIQLGRTTSFTASPHGHDECPDFGIPSLDAVNHTWKINWKVMNVEIAWVHSEMLKYTTCIYLYIWHILACSFM